MFEGLFDEVADLIDEWTPYDAYDSEKGYRDDLYYFLKDGLNRPEILGGCERISVKREKGRGLCDIGVEDKVGIELKKDFRKQSQYKKLIGDIEANRDDYSEGIIVVLVGKTNEDTKEKMEEWIAKQYTSSGVDRGLGSPFKLTLIEVGM